MTRIHVLFEFKSFQFAIPFLPITFVCFVMNHIPILNTGKHPLPAYQTAGSAGMDLYANLEEPVLLKPLQRCKISTGLHLALPPGFEAQVRPRSGLAWKQGITCLNTPGTIDSDYRGEIQVILINLSDAEQTISDGDRIAQLIVAKHEQIQWDVVNQLPDTERGQGGFGSTGIS